jgi:hypothetical protein
MAAPTVFYKVLPEGYTVTGDARNGYKATVNYLMAWLDAFTFADQIFGSARASVVGPITWTLPYRFPVAAANLYAQRFSIKPCGASGSAIPNKGLAPGEYFTHAKVTVEFETPNATQSAAQDDPKNLQQLDPANPITMCEQSIKMAAKMETRKAGSYMYTGVLATPEPLLGDFAVMIPESHLVLTFPKVPYLPRKLIKPYVGRVNSVPVLQAEKGELLLTGMDTKVVETSDGIQQQIQLEFAESCLGDWNKFPDKNGVPTLVYKKGTSDADANRVYEYKDFRAIFSTISYG